MNNYGFTLIELLATIVILSIVLVICFTSIGGIMENNNIKDCKNKIKSVESACKMYALNERDMDKTKVSISQLVSEGYLSTDEGLSDISTNEVSISYQSLTNYTCFWVDPEETCK